MFGVLTLIALGLGVANAQVRTAYPEKRGFKLTDFPRTVKLADNVYGYEDIRNPGFTTVSLFVVGADGVLIVDGQGSPDATRKMLDEIAKVTPKPVKWYIVGSDHGDHTAGNSVLPRDHHLRRLEGIEGADEAGGSGDGDRPGSDQCWRHRSAGALPWTRAHRRRPPGLPAEAAHPVHERGLPQSRVPGDALRLSHRVGERDRQGAEDGRRSIRAGSRFHRGVESLARGARRISKGDARRDRRSHPVAQAWPVGGRGGEAGQLGTVQRVVPVGAARA